MSILRHLDAFCSKHQLRYFLAYGTLLGAVRHKGYIPWDDDIDLMMPRPDYLKFIELFDQGDQGTFKVVSIQNNRGYFANFAKIIDTRTVMYQDYEQVEKVQMGVYIDIFPMDGFPDDETEARSVIKRAGRWSVAYRLAIRKFSARSSNWFKWVLMTLITVPFRIIGPYFFISRLEAVGMANKYDACTLVGCVTSRDTLEQSFERKSLDEHVLLEFEGERYPAPASWDNYLSKKYGDYMTLPPESERGHHFYTVFWKD
ncbi:MAG: LicD family protein [Verrucomicrobiae bacterium]|nr:LicD family protein [Verrucomicrobiae bacterium]